MTARNARLTLMLAAQPHEHGTQTLRRRKT
jgi:hypothetical protein